MQFWDLFQTHITLSRLSKNHVTSKYDTAEIFRALFKEIPAHHVIIPSDNKFIQGLLHIKMFKPLLYTVNIALL
jgi:hypothetical protein